MSINWSDGREGNGVWQRLGMDTTHYRWAHYLTLIYCGSSWFAIWQPCCNPASHSNLSWKGPNPRQSWQTTTQHITAGISGHLLKFEASICDSNVHMRHLETALLNTHTTIVLVQCYTKGRCSQWDCSSQCVVLPYKIQVKSVDNIVPLKAEPRHGIF